MSLTELALGGLAAAALATGPTNLRALKRSDPLLPLRSRGWALASVTIFYAALSSQMLVLRLLVPSAVTLWGALFWQRTQRINYPRQSVRRRAWIYETLKVFVLSCPMLVVLGGEHYAHIEATDFFAALVFCTGTGVLLTMPRTRTNPALMGYGLTAASLWILALREPTGFLTLFAPLLAWSDAGPLLRSAQGRTDDLSKWTQLAPTGALTPLDKGGILDA